MGLDMYIFKNDSERGNSELTYWRKHHDLHYWFEELAVYKGIEFDTFNCVQVPLTKEDLENCIKALDDIYDDESDKSYTRSILTPLVFKAGTGLECYYDSWW